MVGPKVEVGGALRLPRSDSFVSKRDIVGLLVRDRRKPARQSREVSALPLMDSLKNGSCSRRLIDIFAIKT